MEVEAAERAEASVAHGRAQRLVDGREAQALRDHVEAAALPRGGEERVALRQRERHRLLREDVEAVAQRAAGEARVLVGRNAEVDHVDAPALGLRERVVARVEPDLREVEPAGGPEVGFRFGRGEPGGVDVADRDEADVPAVGVAAGVVVADAAEPDEGASQFLHSTGVR